MGPALIMLPVVGAGIGWFTNVLAIKLIFRPLSPIRIPVLNYRIQGVLPRRQEEIAGTIANAVEQELLTVDDIVSRLKSSEFQKELTSAILELADNRFKEVVPSILPSSIERLFAEILRDFIRSEMDDLYGQLLKSVEDRLRRETYVRGMVREKIEGLNLDRLERLILDVAGRELRYIETMGAVLGFIVGSFQAIILSLLPS